MWPYWAGEAVTSSCIRVSILQGIFVSIKRLVSKAVQSSTYIERHNYRPTLQNFIINNIILERMMCLLEIELGSPHR